MKKVIYAPMVELVRFEAKDVITTSGLKPGWGPNKGDGGAQDGHTNPPGQGGGHGHGHHIIADPARLVW